MAKAPTSAEKAHIENGKGRRFPPTTATAPLLTEKFIRDFIAALEKSRLPPGAVAEMMGVNQRRLGRWLHDGRRFLAECQDGDRLTMQALLAQETDKANAKRLEAMVDEFWEAGPKERSHMFGTWTMRWAAPRHLGFIAERDQAREATIEDIEAGIVKAPSSLEENLSEMSDEELSRELAKDPSGV